MNREKHTKDLRALDQVNLTRLIGFSTPNPPFIVEGADPETGDMTGADETFAPPFNIFMPGVQTYLPVQFDTLAEARTVADALNKGAAGFIYTAAAMREILESEA